MIVYCQYYQKARLICFPSTYKTGGNFKKSNNLNQKYNKQLHHFFFHDNSSLYKQEALQYIKYMTGSDVKGYLFAQGR